MLNIFIIWRLFFQVVSTKTKNDDDIIDIVKSDQRCLPREGPSVVNEKSYKNTDVISENITSSNHFDTDDDQGDNIFVASCII